MTRRGIMLWWLALAAPAATADAILYRGVFGEPESLDPDRSGVTSEIAIVNDLFVGLTSYDARGQVTPGVAQSWQSSPDGLTWRFKLRPQLKWSDGEPLTAADFVFSFRRAVTPATAATMADRLFMLRNAEKILAGQAAPATLGVAAPAPDEVLLRLEHPAPQLPILLANGIGFPLPRHALARWGDQWNQAGRMVSNGAFVLVERRPGERVRLAKNAYFYSADETRLDGVVYIPSDDVDTQVNRFRAGELDINSNPGFPFQRQSFLEQELGEAVQVAPYLLVVFLRYNFRRSPFDNLKVRRALALAIDRDKLAEKNSAGRAARLQPGTTHGHGLCASGEPARQRHLRIPAGRGAGPAGSVGLHGRAAPEIQPALSHRLGPGDLHRYCRDVAADRRAGTAGKLRDQIHDRRRAPRRLRRGLYRRPAR
jgi:oligopeptide transport system substrate-binding protein